MNFLSIFTWIQLPITSGFYAVEVCTSLPCDLIGFAANGLTASVGASGVISVSGPTTGQGDSSTYTLSIYPSQLAGFRGASACNILSNTYPVTPVIYLEQTSGTLTIIMPPTPYRADQKLEVQCVALVRVHADKHKAGGLRRAGSGIGLTVSVLKPE
jgi:hypothetical protein